MRSTTVRITKCDKPLAWYADLIGQTFKVYRLPSPSSYVLQEDYDRQWAYVWRRIDFEDCVEVEEET